MNKSSLAELLEILDNMARDMILKEEDISIYAQYNSWQEFGENIKELRNEIENGDYSARWKLRLIFLPTSDWDDSGGLNGYDPEYIIALIDKL